MKRRIAFVMACTVLTIMFFIPVTALADTAGDLTITGGVLDTDYSYDSGTHALHILTGTAMTISGSTTADKIVVDSGVTANLALDGLSINVSGTDNACAFSMSGATVNLSVADGSTNTLRSGKNRAGIYCPDGATLTISGTGTFNVYGGSNGAGIGGQSGSGGTVNIKGATVNAYGGTGGAGIGGGLWGNVTKVTINSGHVTARGGQYGAGIGAGMYSSNGTIVINGGTVDSTGGENGAGIGGGYSGNGGTVTINDGTVTATGGTGGAGIGGGISGSGGTVYISGGSVLATGGVSADDIGAGSSGSSSGTLQNNDADQIPVYLTIVTLADGGGSPIGTASISSLTVGYRNAGYMYGTTDVQTSAAGMLYLYLPDGTRTQGAQTTDGGSPPALSNYTGDIATTDAGGSGTLSLAPPSIVNIEQTGTDGDTNTFTITYSDGSTSTFTVANGQSAYEVAVDNGYTGTEEEWLASLAGAAGADGSNGTNGTDGSNGTNGADGLNGSNGVNGKSAYELAVDNGYTGTEEEWLASLVGTADDTGIESARFNADGELILTLTDGSEINAGTVTNESSAAVMAQSDGMGITTIALIISIIALLSQIALVIFLVRRKQLSGR